VRLLYLGPPDFSALSMLRDYVTEGDAEVVLIHPRAGARLREMWPRIPSVRWIHALSAGVENLLFPELCDRDVVLTNGRGIFASALAEWALAAILHFAKDIPRLMRQRRWEPFTVERIEGQTVGIVGYGSIGRAVAERCAGMRILPFSRHEGSLDEVLRESDYVVVCAPLTEETRGMVDARQMKNGAVLINIGRGAVVDEASLVDALQSHHLKGAALDVFAHEPLPPDHPLWSLDNVLISPHCADHTRDSHERAMQCFLDNLARFERGEALMNVVDKRAGY
jgi:phosphoglycerate dehydrogenase-like enzyme